MFPFDLFDDALCLRRGRSYYTQEQQIQAVVAAVVAEFGFETAIPWLLHTVAEMAEMSLAAPTDTRMKQRFVQWSNAVQGACRREEVPRRSFEQLVSFEDRLWAREIGIRLG